MNLEGSKLFWITRIVLAIILNAGFSSCFAQSLVLRPGIGERYMHSKPNYGLPNNFDPSFDGDYRLHRPTANIALELLYPKHSFELVFTSQMYAIKFYSFYKPEIIQTDKFDGGISQFQFFYNKFFLFDTHKKYSLSLFAGAGVGVGINPPPSYWDLNYWDSRAYGIANPNNYIDFKLTYKPLAKISYSLGAKIGVVLKIKNVERLRLSAVYNLGLNKFVQGDIVYYHTNTKYWGSYTSKGSQFSFLVSVPIYLKRKK
jgi:hypothetical protein